MAKDALGHGSDSNGTHSGAINKLPAKMTRAHFEQIAASLRAQAPQGKAGDFVDPNDPRNPQSNAAWDAHNARVSAMADHLATTNPGFRRDLFVKASQPNTSYKDRSTRNVTKTNASKKLASFNKAGGTTGMSMSTKKYPVKATGEYGGKVR